MCATVHSIPRQIREGLAEVLVFLEPYDRSDDPRPNGCRREPAPVPLVAQLGRNFAPLPPRPACSTLAPQLVGLPSDVLAALRKARPDEGTGE